MEVSSKHIWRFSRVGGVNRVNLERGDDLRYLAELDQKLWTALSCPVHGLEIDAKTLELIDTDKDNRIRVPEILNAVSWICSVITDPGILLNPSSEFPISAINTSNEEGQKLLNSAKQILENLGKENATTISVDDTSDTIKIFANTKFNGDGIITENTVDDSNKQLLQNIIATVGSVIDRSGNQGVSIEIVDLFYKQSEAYRDWHAKAESDKTIQIFGNETEATFQAFQTIQSKIDDYFLRCKLAEFDSESATILNNLTTRFEEISRKDLSTCVDEISEYPLSKIEANKTLSLTDGINPAWDKKLQAFVSLVIKSKSPNKKTLTENEWIDIIQSFDAYKAWKAEKSGEMVESLGIEYVKTILEDSKIDYLHALIEQDKAGENDAMNIILVDKLVRYHRDLFTLLRNFVTFYDFYSPDEKAIFQVGTLFIDQRSCDLCIKVSDMPKQVTMASLSGMFLIYCDCTSKSKNEKMTIVAAMTNGDIDNLIVGRNAIFYDRKGCDWDATVIKIVENPISIRQAFFSPYRKVARFIEKQVDKFASEKDSQVHASTTSNIEKTSSTIVTKEAVAAPVVPAATPVPAQPFDVGKFVGIFAAIGLAIGAIGTALASFIAGFLGLVWWKMPFAVLGIILIISGPSMIIAFLKLRKRNLAPILDANGWAINARAIVNIPFGNTLTFIAGLPKNAKLDFKDPFSNKKFPYVKVSLALLAILAATVYYLWRHGYFAKWGIL
jgi:hypothetical protein